MERPWKVIVVELKQGDVVSSPRDAASSELISLTKLLVRLSASILLSEKDESDD